MNPRSAAVIQQGWRCALARRLRAQLGAARRSFQSDEANRERLKAWVDCKAAAKPNDRRRFEAKAARRLAEVQRKRQTAGLSCFAGDEVGANIASQAWAWLPPGIGLRNSIERGRELVALRPFAKGDVALVERCAIDAALGSAAAGFTEGAAPGDAEAAWAAMVAAFARAPPLARRRVLGMHRHPVSPAQAAHLASFAAKTATTSEEVPSTGRVAGTTAAAWVPLVFQGNACDAGGGCAALPVLGSLVSHACDANTARTAVVRASVEVDAGAAGDVIVEFVCVRDVAAGDAFTVDYLGVQVGTI